MVLSSIRADPKVDIHCSISVESVLRLRPLSKKEGEDAIVLEQVNSVIRNAPATAILNPFHGPSMASTVDGSSSMRSRAESDATANNTPTEYHFNHVLPDSTSQDKIYYTLGLPIATAAMNSLKNAPSRSQSSSGPKSHVLVCMGVTGSGKTYTCFGGNSIPKRRASQDGLVPRLVDSLFSQSKHHASAGSGSKGFAVNVSIVQVSHSKGSDPHACTIHDLLGNGASTKDRDKKLSPKRNKTVRNMAAKFERVIGSPIRSPLKPSSVDFSELDVDNISPYVESCSDVTQAREVLQKGLSTSTKAAKGQNHHLLITLQPIFDGSQVGDKIAILDMAGLEKGKKSQNRGKFDSVANKNQAATAAVLHCLRTMIHNTNVRIGKNNTVGVADDTMSEISSVSQEKNPLQRQLKPVPFRQHKVTMLLQPLFTSSASTKVTVVLAAYPGHADYHEKRLLMQDMELLCGSALISSSADAATGLDRMVSRSFESRSTLTRSTTMDEEDSSVDQKSVRSFRGGHAGPETLRLSRSIDEGDEHAPRPSAYAPLYSKSSAAVQSRPNPTAPLLEATELIPPPLRSTTINRTEQQPKKPNYVSDFPGVQLPSKRELTDPIMERTRVTSSITSANVGGRKAWIPPRRDTVEPVPDTGYALTAVLDTDTYRPKQILNDSKEMRQPLGRSSLENGRPSIDTENLNRPRPARGGAKAFEAISVPQPAGEEDQGHKSNRECARVKSDPKQSNRVTEKTKHISRSSHTAPRAAQTRPTNPVDDNIAAAAQLKAMEKIKMLESQLNETQQEKDAYRKKCQHLQNENHQLKGAVTESVVHNQKKWTKKDQEQYQKSREHRLEDQTLLKKTIRSHLDKVNYIYDIKNQWAMTDKTHFDLQIPSQFQRAPELDVRDREYQEKETDLVEKEIAHGAPKADRINNAQQQYVPPPDKPVNKLRRAKTAKASPWAAWQKFALK